MEDMVGADAHTSLLGDNEGIMQYRHFNQTPLWEPHRCTGRSYRAETAGIFY